MQSTAASRATAGFFGSVARMVPGLLDLLYPPRCVGCGQIDTVWCTPCAQAWATAGELLRLTPPPALQACAAIAWHEGTARTMIHALKFERCHAMADVLGQRMAEALELLGWPVDLLVPVPLHSTRLRERGYNQAQWLAEAVAAQRNLPCIPDALARVRSTPHQVGASAALRKTQIEGAFQAQGTRLQGRQIGLVDDVFTTGATLQACAQAALAGGAVAVFSLTATAARAGAAGAI